MFDEDYDDNDDDSDDYDDDDDDDVSDDYKFEIRSTTNYDKKPNDDILRTSEKDKLKIIETENYKLINENEKTKVVEINENHNKEQLEVNRSAVNKSLENVFSTTASVDDGGNDECTKHIDNQPNINQHYEILSKNKDKWLCEVCTLLNLYDDFICQACENQVKDHGLWICEQCEYINEMAVNKCEVCLQMNPQLKSTVKRSIQQDINLETNKYGQCGNKNSSNYGCSRPNFSQTEPIQRTAKSIIKSKKSVSSITETNVELEPNKASNTLNKCKKYTSNPLRKSADIKKDQEKDLNNNKFENKIDNNKNNKSNTEEHFVINEDEICVVNQPKWNCWNSHCKQLNTPDCYFCNTCKLQRPPPAGSNDLVTKLSKRKKKEIWICQKCDAHNKKQYSICQKIRCGAFRFSQESLEINNEKYNECTERNENNMTEMNIIDNIDHWKCKYCKKPNKPLNDYCEYCCLHRYGSSERGVAIPLMSRNRNKKIWICYSCHKYNDLYVSHCAGKRCTQTRFNLNNN